jgi:enoyl-CoA hydratase/carnithine racemase
MNLKYFRIEHSGDGVAVITFSRPPVNATSRDVYVEIPHLCDQIETDDRIKVAIIKAPDSNKAWCAGADLKELSVAAGEARKDRYHVINVALSRLLNLQRPLIGALNGHCIGMGMVLASICDFRIAASDAKFSMPEVERGMAAPIGIFLYRLNMPAGMLREMLFTGGSYSAAQIEQTNFFNEILPRGKVVEKTLEIASAIAKNRSGAVAATKVIANRSEALNCIDVYKMGQQYSVELAGSSDARREINAFLAKRS